MPLLIDYAVLSLALLNRCYWIIFVIFVLECSIEMPLSCCEAEGCAAGRLSHLPLSLHHHAKWEQMAALFGTISLTRANCGLLEDYWTCYIYYRDVSRVDA